MDANPLHLVRIEALTPDAIEAVITRFESSTDFSHLVYRESELDALWSLADMAAQRSEPHADRVAELVKSAHDLAGEGDPDAAVGKLREALVEARHIRQDRRSAGKQNEQERRNVT